jgi:phosphoesterase RecJ-like protein
VIREIRRGKSFLVTTHENPDGDALGSALALATGLVKLKKKVKVYNRDPVPAFLKFLPNSEWVTSDLRPDERFDAAFIVDCADLDRVSESFVKHPGIAKRIVLDHHARSGRAGDMNLVEVKAASSGVVVYNVLKKIPVPISKEIAVNVYCTLVTDTGSFRYSNTNASVLKLAHELLKTGVEPWTISKNLYEKFPVERLKLLGRVLNTLELSPDGKIASILLTKEMLRETGAREEMAEEFINFARSIDSVEVAVQFREIDGGYKMSFRSKDLVDVAEIASRFGGGGHERAAGCKMKGSLPEIKEKILGTIRKELELYNPKSVC